MHRTDSLLPACYRSAYNAFVAQLFPVEMQSRPPFSMLLPLVGQGDVIVSTFAITSRTLGDIAVL